MGGGEVTHLEAWEAVVEAAREFRAQHKLFHIQHMQAAAYALDAALAALDALSSEPAQVTLAVWEGDEGDMRFVRASSHADRWPSPWRRLGTVTLPLDRERGE